MPKRKSPDERLNDCLQIRMNVRDRELVESAGTADIWRQFLIDAAKIRLNSRIEAKPNEGSENAEYIEAQR